MRACTYDGHPLFPRIDERSQYLLRGPPAVAAACTVGVYHDIPGRTE